MIVMLSYRQVAALYTACLLFGACGKAPLIDTGIGGARTSASGGATALATGGTAGSANAGGSGTSMLGGSSNTASGGVGGSSPSVGSGGAPSCDGIACGPLPATCKKVIQEVGACCPTCTDTGCSPCVDVPCVAGTHKETLPADCCPSCVPDPPDPCLKGQQDYSAVRTQMLDKYGSVGCKNSSDCTLVLEDNACAKVCNVPVPSAMVDTLQTNLRSSAATYCAGCPKPASVPCDPMVPACMNGRCVTANAP